MPVYEFKCNDCNNKFSELRKVDDVENIKCPKCDSYNTKKAISMFSNAGKSYSEPSSSCTPSGGG